MGVKKRAKELKDWYLRHKEAVDLPLIGAGGATAASLKAADILATTPAAAGGAIAATAAVGVGTHDLAQYLARRFPKYAVQGVVSTYAAGVATGTAVAHKILHWNQDVLSMDFLKDAFLNSPTYLALIAASTLGAKAVKWAYDATKPVPPPYSSSGVSRREAIKGGLRTTAAAAGGAYLFWEGAQRASHYVADKIRDWRERRGEGALTLEVRVGDVDGRKDGMISVDDRDVINISIKAKDAEEFNGRDLTLRYSMHDVERMNGWWDSNRSDIPLGERSDLHIEAGQGAVEGMFEFSSKLEQSYDPTSARINPLVNDKDGKGNFKFRVQAYDGENLVGEKWWGGDDPQKFTFNFEGEPQEEAPVPRVPSRGGKKVFIYKQQLADRTNDQQVFATADIWHPHIYDLRLARGGLQLRQIVSDYHKQRTKQQAGAHDLAVLPMLSAFDYRAIRKALESPNSTADMIADAVKREGYAGIAIDFESVRLNGSDSRDLVRFMEKLRNGLPGRQIAIAVSPRFAGSSTSGYRHHGFYDYGALAEHADFIELMAYDFHKGPGKAKSPVLPEDRIAPIVEYAQKNAPNEKIVFLMPLYGHVWTHRGRSVGPLSAVNVQRWRNRGSTRYRNGELEIVTPDRYITAQDRKVFERRLEIMDRYNVQNVGGWRQNHGTPGIYEELRDWKTRN